MKTNTEPITGHLGALTNDLTFSVSLRDLFAAAVYGAVIQSTYPHSSTYKETAARTAYEFADAMLAVRAADAESVAEQKEETDG